MSRIRNCIISSLVLVMSASVSFAGTEELFPKDVYKMGVEGTDVTLLQQSLKVAGAYDEVELTESFDEITLEAVKTFQEENGLAVDGIAGKATISKIIEMGYLPILSSDLYKIGMEHHDISVIQAILHTGGFYKSSEFTNQFDESMKTAVIAFQNEYDLDADGIIGKQSITKFKELKWIIDAPVEKEETTGTLGNLTKSGYKKGDSHPEVQILQQALASDGNFDSTEGYTSYFGEQTESAVIAFQTKYEMDADGVVGSGTIAKMKNLGYVTQTLVAQASPATSRGTVKRFGEYVAWSEARSLLPVGTYVTIQDFYTGQTFSLFVGHGTLHADVEPATAQDTQTMLSIWGGEFTWARRPVLVYYGDRVLAASLNFMPHAGREDKPALDYVSGRSAGFGSGKNYDLVKGNSVSGVMCLHFKGSRVHANKKTDSKHQANVKIAAGL